MKTIKTKAIEWTPANTNGQVHPTSAKRKPSISSVKYSIYYMFHNVANAKSSVINEKYIARYISVEFGWIHHHYVYNSFKNNDKKMTENDEMIYFITSEQNIQSSRLCQYIRNESVQRRLLCKINLMQIF